ncbi:secretion system protein, partial [Candidatus Saccharibacteria bacterium CG10_big_fil_rev_8_21_14_0_10_47_8]
MPQFSYNIISKDGHKSSGLLTSPTREAAVESLRLQGAKPLSVREVSTKKPRFTLSAHKVKLRELVIFTRELSTMIDAGVPLPRGLGTLADQTENKYFKGVILGINRDIESGVPMADAMAKYPTIFNSVYVNMIRAGEAGGILDDILKRLATQVEKDSAIRQKIHS